MEPLAFVRSPIIRMLASCWNGTAVYSEATPGSCTGLALGLVDQTTASATCRMCSGVVPQQPPTRPSPNSVTKPLQRLGELLRG